MTIGERIAKLREQRGMTQDELAKRMGYKSRSTINKVELNKANIYQSNIVKYAEILDTTPAYLMGWLDEDPSEEEKVPETVEISETKKKLYALIDSMSDEKAERLLAFLKE